MRGEDVPTPLPRRRRRGSPPHARGRLQCIRAFAVCMSDHPRMRGEDQFDHIPVKVREGSPPHARGRLGVCAFKQFGVGITPACAGKTVGE